MAGLVDYEYDFFEDYQSAVLDPLPSIEQLIRLDDEVANKVIIARYEGPVDPIEWRALEAYYSNLFADFITERIRGLVDTEPIEVNRDRFYTFRSDIATLNRKLPAQRAARTDVISKPAELLLLKRLRKLGFDPSALDISYIGRGGGLYLLELFVSAAQQEALTETALLTTLLDETASLGSVQAEEANRRLREPVLMVSLWDNQSAGVDAWFENDRHGILEMATATGKTVTGIAAIAECCGVLPDEPDHEPRTTDADIMVVAHSNAILKQWEREIQEKLGLPMPAGKTGEVADSLSFSGGTVEFYTAQSLLPRYDRNLAEKYDLVIYDEVHHYANEEGYGAAIARPNYEAAMGLSATIGDEQSVKREQLTDLLGDIVYTYGVEDARRDGVIPDFDWTVHPTPLDPYERQEWEETTESISNQFKQIKWDPHTEDLLKQLPVPFTELEDLGDFIRAHEAAAMVLDEDAIPDAWSNLQATIHSRTWIRHRSQPKIDGAVDLARKYLADPDRPVKVVVFAMDIDTANRIADDLSDVTDNVFRAHSKLESSSRKNNETVQKNIDAFASCENGVLVSPKMLDEGIDVPDAEVGINVAGTKTKLQLVQRMGRVLRKHGDQRPHFHHFIAVPDDNYIAGLDSKEYVQELNWVRELGETIGVQPIIEEAGVDADLLERAEKRGHELWARDLLEDLEVETVQGNVQLDHLLEELTAEATEILLRTLSLGGDRVDEDEWSATMDALRDAEALTVEGLQRVWWLFPLYRERPGELADLLHGAHGKLDSEATTQERADEESAVDKVETDTPDGGSAETELGRAESKPGKAEDRAEERVVDGDGKSTVTTHDKDPTLTTTPNRSVFEQLGITAPPSLAEETGFPGGVAADDPRLVETGRGGLVSTGHLHARPLESYLLADEQPLYVLTSKKRTPNYDGDRTLPESGKYRSLSLITPLRTLCVVGAEPANGVLQIRHEDVVDVEVRTESGFLRSRQTLVLNTDSGTLTIYDGADTDLDTVADTIRKAAYEQRLVAGDRLIAARDAVATASGLDAVDTLLRRAQETFEAARTWADTHALETTRATQALEFIEECFTSITGRQRLQRQLSSFEDRTREARRMKTEGAVAEADRKFDGVTADLDTLLTLTEGQTFPERAQALTLYERLNARTPTDEAEEQEHDADEPEVREQSTDEEHEGGSPEPAQSTAPTRAALLEHLHALADAIDGVPKASEMDAHGTHSTQDYYREFGAWDDVLEAADLDRRADMLDALRHVAMTVGESPTTRQINEHGRYSAGTYSKEFGSLDAARDAAAIDELLAESSSVTPREETATDNGTTTADEPTQDELLEEITRLDDGTHLYPYPSDMDQRGQFSAYDCQQAFDSWDDALDAAAIDKEARLVEDLQRVQSELGHVPSTTEMNHHGRVSAATYATAFGSWDAATAALDADQTNRGSSTNSEGDSESGVDEQRHERIPDDVFTWDDIPGRGRLPKPIAVEIVKEVPARSSKVDGRYVVADLHGREFEFTVWATHNITIKWTPGQWFVLDQTRGTVWETDGETKRKLDSTGDLQATPFDTHADALMAVSESESG